MPTKPISIILPEAIEPKEYQELLNLISSTLTELVNYGTQVVHWAAYNPKFKKPDLDVPLLMLSRHTLELADAMTALIKNSIINPSKVILRTIFESLLYIKYITTEKSEDRCRAYLVCYIKNKKNEYLKFIEGTPIHMQFKKKIESDSLIKGGYNPFSLPIEHQLKLKIDNLDEWIKHPIFKDAITEYNRMKKQYDRKPPWYLLYNGALNIEDLAKKLKLSYLYEILYRNWSEYAHASDVITGNLANDKSFYSIRNGFDSTSVGSFSISLLVDCYKMLVEFIVPEMIPNFRNWYSREIKSPLEKINNSRIVNG
jgi:hypothetical protein